MTPLSIGALTRFDLLLLVVGVAMLSGGLAVALASVSVYVATLASTAVSALAMFDGLVWRPPTDD
jgi:hypothetical protein